MLKFNNKLLIKIILFLSIELQSFFKIAESQETVYYCKFSNHIIGYYDLPCEYIKFNKLFTNNVNDNSNKDIILLQEAILNLKTNNKLFTNHKKIKENLCCLQAKPRIILDRLPNKGLLNKRCDNAVEKIAAIKNLLQNHYINNSNYQQLLNKLKRSLSRYQKIQKEYC